MRYDCVGIPERSPSQGTRLLAVVPNLPLQTTTPPTEVPHLQTGPADVPPFLASNGIHLPDDCPRLSRTWSWAVAPTPPSRNLDVPDMYMCACVCVCVCVCVCACVCVWGACTVTNETLLSIEDGIISEQYSIPGTVSSQCQSQCRVVSERRGVSLPVRARSECPPGGRWSLASLSVQALGRCACEGVVWVESLCVVWVESLCVVTYSGATLGTCLWTLFIEVSFLFKTTCSKWAHI